MPLTISGEGYRDFSEPRFFEAETTEQVSQIRDPVDKAHVFVSDTNNNVGMDIWKFDSANTDAASDTVLIPLNPFFTTRGRWILMFSGSGGSVSFTPSGLAETIGYFSFGDLGDVGGGDWVFNDTTSLAGFDIENQTTGFTSFSAPNLTSIDLSNTQTGYFQITACSSLTSISVPLLSFVSGAFRADANPVLITVNVPALVTASSVTIRENVSLTSLSLPSLTSCNNGPFIASFNSALTILSVPLLVSASYVALNADTSLTSLSMPSFTTASPGLNFISSGCTLLANVSLPVFLPSDGAEIHFENCALNAVSVNHILARCIASGGYVSGVVDLSGGTNAAPTGQGIADKADLITRGVTVTTN